MEAITDNTITQRTEAAEAVLDDERECLKDEQAAFTQFRKHVAGMDVHAPTPTATTRVKSAIMEASEATTSTAKIEQVRNAYRETVMSMPHYDEDYGQSLTDDIAEEFSPELANALATADTLTPPTPRNASHRVPASHRRPNNTTQCPRPRSRLSPARA